MKQNYKYRTRKETTKEMTSSSIQKVIQLEGKAIIIAHLSSRSFSLSLRLNFTFSFSLSLLCWSSSILRCLSLSYRSLSLSFLVGRTSPKLSSFPRSGCNTCSCRQQGYSICRCGDYHNKDTITSALLFSHFYLNSRGIFF